MRNTVKAYFWLENTGSCRLSRAQDDVSEETLDEKSLEIRAPRAERQRLATASSPVPALPVLAAGYGPHRRAVRTALRRHAARCES